MEKYARVAISEGIRNANDITVTTNSELYRALALHYNRNQQIEVSVYKKTVSNKIKCLDQIHRYCLAPQAICDVN